MSKLQGMSALIYLPLSHLFSRQKKIQETYYFIQDKGGILLKVKFFLDLANEELLKH